LAWLVRNQTAVIGGVLAFAIFIEPTISAAGNADPSVMRIVTWLPGPLSWAVSWPAGVGIYKNISKKRAKTLAQ